MDNIYYDGNLKASLTVGNINNVNSVDAYTKEEVNELIEDMATISYVNAEITNIELTPGPKGDKGDKGDTGEPGTTDYNELINKPEIPSVEGMVTSTVIKEIKVVDVLPDVEEDGILYLVRGGE